MDTAMGFTHLEGARDGTRSADLDPAILDYVASKEGLSLPEGAEGPNSRDDSRLEVCVVPTVEELLIARDAVRVVQGLESRY